MWSNKYWIPLISYLQAGGGSRGSYLVLSEDGQPISERLDKNVVLNRSWKSSESSL